MFSWIATFDNEHNMTEVYKGSAPDESSAFKDMIATARGVYRERPDVRARHCSLGIAADRFVPYKLSTAATSVLLPDEELIELINAAMEAQRYRDENYRRTMEESRASRKKSVPSEVVLPTSVGESWARISAWCDASTPGWDTEFAPSTAELCVRYAAATSLTWPEQLVDFYTVHNGTRGMMITPLGPFLSLDEMQTYREAMLQAWSDQPDEDAGEAGTFQRRFVKGLIPIAGNTDSLFVVDLRPGAAHGSVGLYYGEDGIDSSPQWENLATFVGDIASALENGSTFWSFHPVVSEGYLDWDLD